MSFPIERLETEEFLNTFECLVGLVDEEVSVEEEHLVVLEVLEPVVNVFVVHADPDGGPAFVHY